MLKMYWEAEKLSNQAAVISNPRLQSRKEKTLRNFSLRNVELENPLSEK